MTLTTPDTRTRLLDVAAQRFLEDGYVETSLRSIAEAMGIKAGSIYYHFESKDEILAEVLDTGIKLITRSVQSALDGVTDPRHRLTTAITAHLGALFEHGAYTACHVRVFHQAPIAVQERTTVGRDRYESLWNDLLEEAAQTGLLSTAVDPVLARLFLLGALNNTVEWFSEGDQTVEAVAHTFSLLFLDGAARKEPL